MDDIHAGYFVKCRMCDEKFGNDREFYDHNTHKHRNNSVAVWSKDVSEMNFDEKKSTLSSLYDIEISKKWKKNKDEKYQVHLQYFKFYVNTNTLQYFFSILLLQYS